MAHKLRRYRWDLAESSMSMEDIMKRLVVFAFLVSALLANAAWATDVMNNKYGTIAISASGIVTKGSELVYFEGIVPPGKESMGTVTFTTGDLISGTLEGGGIFSHVDSSFIVVGNGVAGAPKGLIFAGVFDGQIHWTLVSQSGQKLVFKLRGNITGVLYTGETVRFETTQTITTTVGQLGNGIAHIVFGKVVSHP